MPEIGPGYASPGLRWGLLLEDHPGADADYTVRKGTDIGIPPQAGGTGDFCVAEITFPQRVGEAQRAPVIGYKPLPSKIDADAWNLLCTKALGRALKRAGYPDKLPDLKALVLWRQREAEIEAIRVSPRGELGTGEAVTEALAEAASTEAEHATGDDGDAPDDEIADAEIVYAAGEEPFDAP